MGTIVELFISVDDFCKALLPVWENHLISHGHKKRKRQSRLSISEMITNKVFLPFAQLGKTTKGWCYRFNFHLICNHRGELVACRITPGNVDDREPVLAMTKGLKGKLFGDS